jgi:hypothetical protein
MTMPLDDDDDLPPPRPTYDDKTAWGRINGRDRHRYAALWGVDLDRPREDDLMSGEEEYGLTVKLMTSDHHKCEDRALGPIGVRGGREGIDLEEFAAAWRPMTESEYLDEEIERRREEEAERLLQRAEAEAARRRWVDPETNH